MELGEGDGDAIGGVGGVTEPGGDGTEEAEAAFDREGMGMGGEVTEEAEGDFDRGGNGAGGGVALAASAGDEDLADEEGGGEGEEDVRRAGEEDFFGKSCEEGEGVVRIGEDEVLDKTGDDEDRGGVEDPALREEEEADFEMREPEEADLDGMREGANEGGACDVTNG